MCRDGSVNVSQSVHGTRKSATKARSGATQRATGGPGGMTTLYPARVRLRSPRPESLLAWAAALVGAIGIASALTPEFADRVDLIRGVLPPGFPTAARVGALAFGILLIWLSRSLARRRRRAWQLAVVVVIASAIAHLAKGLDVEEAGISLLLLAALVRWRARFTAPGDPEAARPLFVVLLLAAGVGALTARLELRGVAIPDRL